MGLALQKRSGGKRVMYNRLVQLPTAVETYHSPNSTPDQRAGASLLTTDKPIGANSNSPNVIVM